MKLKLGLVALLCVCVQEGRPDSLLVATDSRIARLRLTDDAAAAETLHGQPASTVRSRRDATTQELYFVTNGTVYYSFVSSYLGGRSGDRSDALVLGRLSGEGAVRRLAVDWVSPRLHVTRGRRLIAATMLGGHAEPEIELDHDIDDMAVDPYQRVMFVSAGGQVYAYALGSYDSAARLESVTSEADDVAVRLAVDHHRRRLYALVAAGDSGTSRLLATDYDGSNTRLVYAGEALKGARALDQLGGRLTWARCLSAPGGCHLYACTPGNETACTDGDVALLWHTDEVVNDVIFRSAKRHSPPAELACRELHCGHACDSSDPYSVHCSCPSGQEHDAFTNTCREPTHTLSACLARSVAWLRSECDRLAWPALVLAAVTGATIATSLVCVCLCLAVGAGRHARGDDRESYAMRHGRRRQPTPKR